MTDALQILTRSPFFEPIPDRHLSALATEARVESHEAGGRIIAQHDKAEACYVLIDGAVTMSVSPGVPDEDPDGAPADGDVVVRRYDDPGRVLGWSALVPPFRYRATVTALQPTRVLRFERRSLERYMDRHPDFGVAFMERLIWVLGNRLRETRTRLITRRYDRETLAIRALLDQSAEQLHVDSTLHKLPYYLANRLTVADAFQALELVKAHGDENERDIANHALEILEQVRKELRLYQDLQKVYEIVAHAPKDMPPEDIRRRCGQAFIALFEKLDCVIAGEENLPDSPGHIFIMNHLVNHPDNTLPNQFQLTLDTHFVSSMLLLRKYGEAPVRVIRKSLRQEFGHQGYYDRLGNIYVYSGHIDEAAEDPGMSREDRRREFLEAARGTLLAGRNLVICPEGTSVRTENSPVAFKAGAFRLAALVSPEPLIVPIAVANFDKRITRTKVAAVVHPPVRLSDFVSDPDQDDELFAFVNECQRRMRGWVRDAIALTR